MSPGGLGPPSWTNLSSSCSADGASPPTIKHLLGACHVPGAVLDLGIQR